MIILLTWFGLEKQEESIMQAAVRASKYCRHRQNGSRDGCESSGCSDGGSPDCGSRDGGGHQDDQDDSQG